MDNDLPENIKNFENEIDRLYDYFSLLMQNQITYINGDEISEIIPHEMTLYIVAMTLTGYKIQELNIRTFDIEVVNETIPNSFFRARYITQHCPYSPAILSMHMREQPIRLLYMIARQHQLDPIDFLAMYILYLLCESIITLALIASNDNIGDNFDDNSDEGTFSAKL